MKRLNLSLPLTLPPAHPDDAPASAAQRNRLDRLHVASFPADLTESQADWLIFMARELQRALQPLLR